jgi:hypothetical protein
MKEVFLNFNIIKLITGSAEGCDYEYYLYIGGLDEIG